MVNIKMQNFKEKPDAQFIVHQARIFNIKNIRSIFQIINQFTTDIPYSVKVDFYRVDLSVFGIV